MGFAGRAMRFNQIGISRCVFWLSSVSYSSRGLGLESCCPGVILASVYNILQVHVFCGNVLREKDMLTHISSVC